VPMAEQPQLSVIVSSFNSARTIAGCLKSLRNQRTDKVFEIIVVDSSTDGTAALVRERFPEVRLYTLSERHFCGEARNLGISVAKADIIALIDADCVAAANWVDRILEAHRLPHPAIGGAIANAEPSNLVGWAAYFCEFSQWMPETSPGWFDDVAGANMSYKRKVFDELGSFIEGTYCSDTEFNWRLERIGKRVCFEPSILVWHSSIDSLSTFLRHEYEHGRCFARVRSRARGFSPVRRWTYALLSFLLPAKLLARIGLRNLRNRRHLPSFIKALPLLALGCTFWCAGECVGYVEKQRNPPAAH